MGSCKCIVICRSKPDELQSRLDVLEADKKRQAEQLEKAKAEQKREIEEQASQAQAGVGSKEQ